MAERLYAGRAHAKFPGDPAVPQPRVLSFVLRAGTETVLVVHNLGDARVTAGPWPLKAAPTSFST
jgi:hypothetical protein